MGFFFLPDVPSFLLLSFSFHLDIPHSWLQKKCFHHFIIKYDVCDRVCMDTSYSIEKVPFTSSLLAFMLCIHRFWILLNVFFCICWNEYLIALFKFVKVVLLNWFKCYADLAFHTYTYIYSVQLIFCLGFLCLCSDSVCNFPFLSLSGLVSRLWQLHFKSWGIFPLTLVFGKVV